MFSEEIRVINCVISNPIPLINIIPIINPALKHDDPTINNSLLFVYKHHKKNLILIFFEKSL